MYGLRFYRVLYSLLLISVYDILYCILCLASNALIIIMKNVEIKAKVRCVVELIDRAAKLSGSNGEIIKQEDMFYKVPQGRLKLRKFENNTAELLYYLRPDVTVPKTCSYKKFSFSDNINDLHEILSDALGQNGIVKKIRRLFMVGQTRIHVDSVEGLGDFMELEVVLRDDQSSEDGEKIASDLMEKLGVNKTDLIAGAYTDLLNGQ